MNEPSPAECVVEVGGVEIDDLYPALAELTVETRRKDADLATLVFEIERISKGTKAKWSVLDDARIVERASVQVSVRFGQRRRQTVITGQIIEIKPEFPADMGAAKLTVKVQDETVLLERVHARKNRSNEKAPRTDQQIVSELAREVGLKARIPEPGLTNENLNQDQTSAAFIKARAEANGFEFYVREGELYFGPPELDKQAQGTIMLYAGPQTNCISFSAERDAKLPDELWLVRPPKQAGQQEQRQKIVSDLPLLGKQVPPRRSGAQPIQAMISPSGGSEAEVKAAAKAKANDMAWLIKAQGELDGEMFGAVLRPHGLVEVDGAGELLDGRWYVDAVRHQFSAKGWRQSFQLLRNAVGAS